MRTILLTIASRGKPVLEVIAALLIGLLLGAALMAGWGYDPWKAYLALLEGSFGNLYSLASTLSKATPLILTGLTFAIGLRAGLFNIGAQGQMVLGALVAVAASTLRLPTGLHLVVALALAMFAGAAWSLPASWLKGRRGISEVISTIMLNSIAVWLARYLLLHFLNDPQRGGWISIMAGPSARFPTLVPGSELTYSIFASLAFALAAYWLLWHMVPGFELRCSGLNAAAARYAGIEPQRSINLAFILGGLAAGLTGATQVLGRFPYSLDNGLTILGTLGFDGIAVALVGRNHPLGIIVAAVFFGALSAGGGLMGFRARVPLDVTYIVQGVIILAVAAPEIWRILRGLFPTLGCLRRGRERWNY
ncbi:MAG: ABC transporter permease [Candidatus Acetothermia bacterium]|nr:ABC transporter permease [Candidatus Acetothermia bacterium]MDH7504658.1 ABC transporter permease [Candidatus Acetothermia bacterium]